MAKHCQCDKCKKIEISVAMLGQGYDVVANKDLKKGTPLQFHHLRLKVKDVD